MRKPSSKRLLVWARNLGASRPLAAIRAVDGLVECRCCGFFQDVAEMKPGYSAHCSRCGQHLTSHQRTGRLAKPTAFCISALAIYLAMLATSLMTIDVYGRERTVDLLSGPMELFHEGWGEIGLLVALVTIVLPGLVIVMVGAILYAASKEALPSWATVLLIWYERLRPWSMVEIYVLGVFVAYTKLVDMAYVYVDSGVYLVAALMVTMAATDTTLDTDEIWERRRLAGLSCETVSVKDLRAQFADNLPVNRLASCRNCGLVGIFAHPVAATKDMGACPRCASTIRKRKSDSVSRTLALLVAATIFYVPANMLPVMTFIKVGQGGGHTILNGVIELWQDDMIPLALLVLFASILVPVAKIVGLGIMTISAARHSAYGLVLRSKVFRVVDIVGRWSMIDVFMISILVAVVRFASLANVTANAGVVCFATVVVLTIFAVYCFDPRVMWDAAGLNDAQGLELAQRDRSRVSQSQRDRMEPLRG